MSDFLQYQQESRISFYRISSWLRSFWIFLFFFLLPVPSDFFGFLDIFSLHPAVLSKTPDKCKLHNLLLDFFSSFAPSLSIFQLPCCF